MTTLLRVFRPHLSDVIDPNHTATPGQVVRCLRKVGEDDVVISTPDGKTDLGFVNVHSLKNLPRNTRVKFDPETGYTEEAKQLLS
jgi:hypothetical protein